jgi:hypothetical protein
MADIASYELLFGQRTYDGGGSSSAVTVLGTSSLTHPGQKEDQGQGQGQGPGHGKEKPKPDGRAQVVGGGYDFGLQVLTDLAMLCPCFDYITTPTKGGGLLITVPNYDYDPVPGSETCVCVCLYRYGCDLVAGALEAPGINVYLTSEGNGSNPRGPGAQQASDVHFNPDAPDTEVGKKKCIITPNRSDEWKYKRPSRIGLAHELIHILHGRLGKLGADSSGHTTLPEEENTCADENLIRKEQGMARMREGDSVDGNWGPASKGKTTLDKPFPTNPGHTPEVGDSRVSSKCGCK